MLCFVLIFGFLIRYCQAEYITQPVSLNTSLNSTVTFTCQATGASFIFFYVGEIPASQDINVNRGFTELSQVAINGTIRRQLSVHAREINNNTYVSCAAIPGDIRSDNATLTIQGLLDNVVDLDYTFINGSSVLLTWTAPYTLDNVPITGYYIVNGLVNITTTNKSNILSATNPDPCILNNVSVSPINDVGIGSSNNISFYYETVSAITPSVSVVPVVNGQQLLMNISINVSVLCKGEYPNSITVNILNTTNAVIKNTSILTQANDQLMITGVITVPNNLNTFIVNVSLSNNGGIFYSIPSFTFGFPKPVINIKSSINNCSTINVSWNAATGDNNLYYNLSIYNTITNQLLKTVSVYSTSYQFVDNNLFIHRYTYVITGVNELGEGISNNDTFSYQRVPRAVQNTSLDILYYTQDVVIVQFYIPQVILECTGEAPDHVTVTVQCNGTDSSTTYQIRNMNDITGLISVPQYQQCNISIVFSNEAGSSEPFILAFGKYVLKLHITVLYYVPTENGPEVEAAALEFEKCSYVTNDAL
uniref:Fibronectin type-III domain-containing protein n=1 Tax=Amphimedon queenslandica TaxID=400682 RepID=A0A1X7TKJ5_AMPQE